MFCVFVFAYIFVSLDSVNCLVYKPNNAYSESVLKPVRSFSDVSIFHYSVPQQSSQAIWTFLAFTNDPSCSERLVHIYLRFGSYPVVSIDNSLFPNDTLLPEDLDENQYSIKTRTHFQPNEMPQIDIINPLPGSWFAIAFINDDNNEAIRQEGISHVCHYSIGCMASWNQELNIHLLIPSVPTYIKTFSETTLMKVFVPENTWQLSIDIRDCKYEVNSTRNQENNTICDCIDSVQYSADSLPFMELNQLNSNLNSKFYTILQPQTNVYYYIKIQSKIMTKFTIEVNLTECEEIPYNADWFPSPLTFDRELLSKSISLHSPKKLNLINTNFITNKSKEEKCVPTLPLMRIKHAQDFLDSFLFQGSDWFSSRISIQDSSLLYVRFEILPFIDIGGTMIAKFFIEFNPLTENSSDSYKRFATVEICMTTRLAPQFNETHILCPNSKQRMMLHSNISYLKQSLKYVPFPSPGLWYIALRAKCFNSIELNNTLFHNETQCQKGEINVDLRIRLQPCILDGDQCGGHGFCKESHFKQFYYSSCHCTDGWKGWACNDGTDAVESSLILVETMLLILSNLFFMPAVYLAIKWRFYAEAVVYLATLFFSSFYHACDTEILGFCIFKYDVLQFCDFYSAILSFWVTVVAMAALPISMSSMAHMAGALGIALAVQSEKTGFCTFIVPVVSGLAIMLFSWGSKCWYSKSFKLTRKLLNLIPGMILVAIGFVLFAFLETEANYKYVHSAWHVTIALSITLLLPRNQMKESGETQINQCVHEAEQDVECINQPEMIDIGEYRLNSDLTSLIDNK